MSISHQGVASGRDHMELIPLERCLAAGREQLVFVVGIGSLWEPGGALCTIGVSLEGTLSRCEISTLRMDKGLCDLLFDLRNCFDLLWDEGENAISSVGCVCRTVPQDCFGNAMVTGNSQPDADRKGIDFQVHVQIP